MNVEPEIVFLDDEIDAKLSSREIFEQLELEADDHMYDLNFEKLEKVRH